MRKTNKRSAGYKTKAELKKERKELRNKSKMEKKYLVGIYDSYRTGGKYNKLISNTNSKFIGSYSTEPDYTMYDLNADDVVIVDKEGYSIKIEVWEISETTLKLMKMNYSYYDELPNDQNIYLQQKVFSPFGEIILFVYNDLSVNLKIVESGDWIEYLNYKRVMGDKKENVL